MFIVYTTHVWQPYYQLHVHVGSRSSVVRAPTAQAGGPGFDPQWLPRIFSLSAGLY